MKHLALLFLLAALNIHASEVADVLLRDTAGWTPGSNITTAEYFNAITLASPAGAGTWATNGAGHTSIFHSVVATNLYKRAISIDGTNYADATNNLGIAMSLANDNAWLQYNFAAPQSEALLVCMWKPGAYHGGSSVFDWLNINAGSKDVIPQYWESTTINGVNVPVLYAHNAFTTAFDQPIANFTLGSKWYIVTAIHSTSQNLCRITLIDADNGVVVGQSQIVPGLQSELSPFVSMGRFDNHGTTGSSPDDSIIKDWHVLVGANALAPYHFRDQIIWSVNHATAGSLHTP